MALVKDTLKEDILSILTDMRSKENVCDAEFAERLSTAIDTFIKTATVTTTVATTGTATAQTGTGTGTLS